LDQRRRGAYLATVIVWLTMDAGQAMLSLSF
jgi:hypothetical protein